jgi:poly-gamma-glutamate synthase PgsB/CapB
VATERPNDYAEVIRGFLAPVRAKTWIRHVHDFIDRARAAGVAQATPLGALKSAELSLRHSVSVIRTVAERSMRLQQESAKATTDEERRELMVAHLIETVPNQRQRRGDMKALDRWMNLEALVDREIERNVAATQVGMMCLEILRRAYAVAGPETREQWRRDTKMLPFLVELAGATFKPPLREEALLTIGGWVRAEPALVAELDPAMFHAWASERREPTWVQVAAVRTYAVVAPNAAADLIRQRLAEPGPEDDFLVRRNAMAAAMESLREHVSLSDLDVVRADPSEHVRQQFASALLERSSDEAITMVERIVEGDASAKVRAYTLRETVRRAQALKDADSGERTGRLLLRVLENDASPLVVQVAIDGVIALKRDGLIGSAAPFVPLLTARTEGDPDASERAGAALRALEVAEDPHTADIRAKVAKILETLREFKTARLALPPSPENDIALMRAIRDAARGDMGLYIRRVNGGYDIQRGERRVRRVWRILHEIKRRAPDKRSGYVHTRARISEGEIIIPPVGMCEVTPTPVPGERNIVRQVAGWGPFLPRLDDILSAIWRKVPTYIATTAGIITVIPPKTWKERIRAWWKITLGYAAFAEQREHSLRSIDPPDRRKYIELLETLGVRVVRDVEPGQVDGVPYTVKLPIVATYFPEASACIPLLVGPIQYFASDTGGNTPAHLAVMTFAMYTYLLIRAALIQRSIDVARASIPLRIGGWGTRGKSGTERLKAGLFQGLGFNTVVKTTGCEAMFIHAVPWQKANEIFLFRPYDKPTIWEQRDVLRTGQAMKAEVFLWECMALRPNFVQLLGQMWMRDEITTLTNAFPDHEDVMGPNGEEVARVIGIFMAVGGTTYTTEVEMLPVLREASLATKTRLREIPPLEGDLLPDDMLKRFPYDEHPRNISLVQAVAAHLGIDTERSMVEMADNVVPDLGVLKTYPRTTYRGRSVQFSNGMSANERAGFLSCWTRLSFDKSDPDEKPTEFIATIINNRADRVPRSRVFARITVRDAERHASMCIGTNLNGLHQFIGEELDAWLAEAWVADDKFKPGDAESTKNVLDRYDVTLKRVKVSTQHEKTLRIQLRAMLVGAGAPEADADAAVAAHDWHADPTPMFAKVLGDANVPEAMVKDATHHAVAFWTRSEQALDGRKRIGEAKSVAEANAIFKETYRKIFMDQIHVLWNALATGDQVADQFCGLVPPGFTARLMGVQNIKGTGLDFVYRWLSLDSVEYNLRRLVREPQSWMETLAWLGSYNYGIVECNHALDAITKLLANLPPELAPAEEQMRTTQEHLTRLRAKLAEKLGAAKKPSQLEILADKAEPWLDFIDSMARRRLAGRIQTDFIDRRVGHLGAADLMRDLTKRDKGGWLVKWVQKKTAAKA